MSLFKEKDDYIKKAFQDIFCRDTDSEDEEFQNHLEAETSIIEIDEEETNVNDQRLSDTLIILDDDEDNEDVEQKNEVTTPPKISNEIKVKLQDGNLRHTKEFKICKDQTVDHLKNLYAKEFNITNLDSIKLWFDGDLIDEGLTPEELDIEDDCVLDVMIHN